MTAAAAVPEVRITVAEKQLLDVLLERGATNAVIGRAVFKTEDTIKAQLKKLMRKVGADTRTELVVTILRDRVKLVVETPDETKARAAAQGRATLAARVAGEQGPGHGGVTSSG